MRIPPVPPMPLPIVEVEPGPIALGVDIMPPLVGPPLTPPPIIPPIVLTGPEPALAEGSFGKPPIPIEEDIPPMDPIPPPLTPPGPTMGIVPRPPGPPIPVFMPPMFPGPPIWFIELLYGFLDIVCLLLL